ncbi:hypothetical protein BKA70DRAFT_1454292 [Coprinopsis sp. MPI-PUGE-AT-0042]|nr:hypothetical protein BKA70DRAFT_1454292 [Coprinopsis sp. MPI-PUGE-AT-0042]
MNAPSEGDVLTSSVPSNLFVPPPEGDLLVAVQMLRRTILGPPLTRMASTPEGTLGVVISGPTTTSKSPRRSRRPHRPPAKFRETASNPFLAPAKLQRLKTSSPKVADRGYHLPSPVHAGSPRAVDTPTRVKVEETTPVRGLLLSPYIGMVVVSDRVVLVLTVFLIAARDEDVATESQEPMDIPTGNETKDHGDFEEDHQPAGTISNADCARSRASTPSSQVFEDGVAQPDEWAFWPPAPSSDNLAAYVEHTSDIEESSRSQGMFRSSPPSKLLIFFLSSGLSLDESFFRNNTIRIFDPFSLPPSNMSALLDFASRYPAGVHTMAYLNMFRQCLRCDRLVLADKKRLHKCPAPGKPVLTNPDSPAAVLTVIDLSVKFRERLGIITVNTLRGRSVV